MSDQVRILVVDDEVYIADLVATALRYEGFAVQKAGTGRDASSPAPKSWNTSGSMISAVMPTSSTRISAICARKWMPSTHR
jgi:DNA-binding NtrC family response regulator